MGWGAAPWGAGEWGAGGDDLQLVQAVAIRENMVRLTFNTAPRFTGVLDPHDASNPERYQVVAISDAREVEVVHVEQAAVDGAVGAIIDITLDRSMTGYPEEYRVAVNQLTTMDGALLDVNFTSYTFPALYRYVQPPARDLKLPSRDIANPQTLQAMLDPLPDVSFNVLGSIPVNADGDYAFDDGITNLKKRIYRRLLTSKGKFAALPDYGVGVPGKLKKLGTAAVRLQLAAEAEKQIAQEPDVLGVKVRVENDQSTPGLTRFKIRVRAKFSDAPIDVDIPFAPVE